MTVNLTLVQYRMKANLITDPAFPVVTWLVDNTPDYTGAFSGYPASSLANIAIDGQPINLVSSVQYNIPTGPASGDLSGQYPSPTVNSLTELAGEGGGYVAVNNVGGLSVSNVAPPFAPNNQIYVDNYVSTTTLMSGGIEHCAITTSGSNILSIGSSGGSFRFTPAMVGMYCRASNFPNNGANFSTIASYISPTQVTLNTIATGSAALGSILVFGTNQIDTTAILTAAATGNNTQNILSFGSHVYVINQTLTLQNILGIVGTGSNQCFFTPATPSQKGDLIVIGNCPQSFICKGLNIDGNGYNTPAYVTSSVVNDGYITCTVTNNVALDIGARIQLLGSRNSALPLNFTYFITTGTPTTSGFTAEAITWDGRAGVYNVSNIAITAGVVEITTTAINQVQAPEVIHLNSLINAAFLNNLGMTIVSPTVSGTTSIYATVNTKISLSQTIVSGGNVIYTGSFSSTNYAGISFVISGFTNAGNNGTFIVISSTSTTITVVNASGVNETNNSATAAFYSFSSISDTGVVAYLKNGTYIDNIAVFNNYVGLRVFCNAKTSLSYASGQTIINQALFDDVNISGFQGNGCTLAQPNYMYITRCQFDGNGGGLLLDDAYPTTEFFTNPSCFEIGGGCQFNGNFAYGLCGNNIAGGSINIPGCNGNGTGLLLYNCSGVQVNSFDIESNYPMPGFTDLFQGNYIEMAGGTGNKISGGFMQVGNLPSGISGSADQKMFYAWNNAHEFSYENVFHNSGGNGYVQPTNEILCDITSNNYRIANLKTLTSNNNLISLDGPNYELNNYSTHLLATPEGSGSGIFLQNSSVATSSTNYNSANIELIGNIWNGTTSVQDSWVTYNQVGSGTNPTSAYTLFHTGSSGDATVNLNGYTYIDSTRLLLLIPNIGFQSEIVSPVIGQDQSNLANYDGYTLTIQAQNCYGTSSIGGNLTLSSGAGSSSKGLINLQVAGTNVITINEEQITMLQPTYFPPVTAPTNPSSGWALYTDTADGKLKAKASTGTIVTLGTP